MFLLSNSIKKTLAIVDGYYLGRVVFENIDDEWIPHIELEHGSLMNIKGIEDTLIIKVLKANEWYKVEKADFYKVTPEGWPLLGGFDCIWKEVK